MVRLAGGLILAGLLGCAYYNALYNANQLARDAERAEREGRIGEARSLWARAAVKAESVTVRFPDSRYRPQALLLQGRALRQIEACADAMRPLTLAADSSPVPSIRHEARLLLGACLVAEGSPDRAHVVLTAVVDSGPVSLLDDALWWRGQASLVAGDHAAAAGDLAATTAPDAVFPRAVALVGLGEADLAKDLLSERVAGRYSESAWFPVLDSLGVAEPGLAAELVDRLVSRRDLTEGQRGRLLLADAARWRRVGNQERAGLRAGAAAQAAADSMEGHQGRALAALHRLRLAEDPAVLPAILAELNLAVRAGGEALATASPARTVLENVIAVLRRSPTNDLDLLEAAEQMRDLLGAVPMAAHLFRELARTLPDSPLAPKALLAYAQLRPTAVDSVVAVLRRDYSDSPYTMVLDGRADARYQALQDSLLSAQRERRRAGIPPRDRQ